MKLTIRRGVPSDAPALKALWRTAFADSEAYIDSSFPAIGGAEAAIAAFCGETLVSMLFLLKGTLWTGEEVPARYVYCAATAPEYRGRGAFRELEAHAVHLAASEGDKALVLVPSEPGLFAFYQRLGYRTRFYLAKSRLPSGFVGGASLSPCGPETFFSLRGRLLSRCGAAFRLSPALEAWAYRDWLLPAEERPAGEILLAKSWGVTGYTVGRLEGTSYLIRETDLTGRALCAAGDALRARSGARSVAVLGRAGRRFAYGMIKPLGGFRAPADGYMNLMLD